MRPHPFHRRSQRVAECRREDCDVSVAVSVEVGVLINDRDRITFTLGENGTGEPPPRPPAAGDQRLSLHYFAYWIDVLRDDKKFAAILGFRKGRYRGAR